MVVGMVMTGILWREKLGKTTVSGGSKRVS
jgi:hypothetical protein